MDKYKKMQRNSSRTPSEGSRIDYEYFCMKVILTIFKLCGLAPWIIVKKSPGEKVLPNDIPQMLTTTQFAYSRFGCVYQIFLVILNFGINYLTVPLVWENHYPYKTQLTVTIEMAQAICVNIILITIRILLCVKQNTVVKLFNRFTNIDGTIICLSNNRNSESNGLFIFLLLFSNSAVWTTVILSEHNCFDVPFFSMFNDIYPLIIVIFFMIQYIIMVKLIENRLRALNHALLDRSRSSIIQPIQSLIRGGISINNIYTPKIVTFRQIHTILYEITCDVSEFYSLPILLVIAGLCYSTIYNAYYLLIPFVLQLELDNACLFINALSSLLGLLLPIVMLSAGINRITSEMRKTADAVHKLIARSTISIEDKSELQQFSLELLHRNVQFTAYGLFSLDCTLVHSIFSTVVTYLIILFQFQMAGERNNSQDATENNSTAR